ncbi:MAG: dTMP kinase [Frankiaceae bacterium]|nr:dTMP kinase [Frankiaceae bacterium]
MGGAVRTHVRHPASDGEAEIATVSPSPAVRRGRFLALEGGEGAGKSTQAERLADDLRRLGHEVVVTREPGATTVGAALRQLLLDPDAQLTDRTEALLYAADRAEHVARVVRPALEHGAVVITDRYVDSSVAYQGYGRGLDPAIVLQLSRWATGDLVPDLTVLLDLPVADGLARARARGRLAGAPTDRIEAETRAFFERIRAGFRQLHDTAPERYALIDAAADPDEVAAAVRHAVQQVLAGDGEVLSA